MRSLHLVWPALLALTVAGCGGSDGPTLSPLDPPHGSTATTLGGVAMAGKQAEVALALYTLRVDPATSSATVSLKATRSGQETDDVYLLSIDNFLKANSLNVRSVAIDGAELDITYTLTHPFPAPSDLTAPPNASTNRADLGISGRVLWLLDTPMPARIGGSETILANTELVTNADGYYAPAGLLSHALSANAFPYKMLVDESGLDGNRVGISNGGTPLGNYGPDGWTAFEMGGTHDQWTGYGVLHQGQTAVNTVSLDLAALGAAPIDFDVAVVAKYNDPRGGVTGAEKKANRLPPQTPDPSRFAYRMPHGALDLERIEFLGATGDFLENAASGSTLAFRITDWDARATETALPNLSDDPAVTNVAQGEAGLPSLELAIPGILGDANTIETWVTATDLLNDDTAFGGDVAEDSGRPGDGLVFARTVSKGVSTGQIPGTYTGFLRVIDPEDGQTLDWKIPLDPTLQPLASNLPRPVVYQAFPVELLPDTPIPSNGWGNAWGGTGNDYAYALAVASDGSSFVSGYYASGVDFGGGPRAFLGASDIYLVKYDPDGNYLWDKVFGNSFAQIGWALGIDSADNIYLGGQIRGDLDFGGGIMSAPTNNDSFLVSFDSNGTWRWDKYLGSSSTTDRVTSIAVDPADNVYVSLNWSGTANFGSGPITGTDTAAENGIIKYTSAGTWLWDKQIKGPGVDVIHSIDVNSAGDVYATGYFANTTDLGDGIPIPTYTGSAASSPDAFAFKWSSAGTFLWKRTYGQTGSESSLGSEIAVDPNDGSCVIAGDFDSAFIDLGSGPVPVTPSVSGSPQDNFLVKLDSSGTFQWQKFCASNGNDQQPYVAIDNAGNVFHAGRMSGTYDFGLGPYTPPSFSVAYLAKYNAAGSIQWNSFIESIDSAASPTLAQNGAYSLVTGPGNNLWMTGFWHEHADLDPSAGAEDVTNTGNNDAYLVKILGSTGLW